MAAALSVALALAPPPPVSHAVTTEQLLFLEVKLLCFGNLAMSPRSSGPPNAAALFTLGPVYGHGCRASGNACHTQSGWVSSSGGLLCLLVLECCKAAILSANGAQCACSSACYILTGVGCRRMGC